MAYGLLINTSDGQKSVIDANTVYLSAAPQYVNTTAASGSFWIPNFNLDTHDLYVISTNGFTPIWWVQNGNQFVWENYNGASYQCMLLPLRKTY